jgi:hypothetical protein
VTTPDGALPDDASRPEDAQSEDAQSDPHERPGRRRRRRDPGSAGLPGPAGGTDDGTGSRIEPVGIEVEMQRSYLDYAMSVIVGRALPDVRDGLKPVHRKILYAMFDSGYRPDRGYVKCSRVVGDRDGPVPPHGDSSIYDALVRMAQPWSLRYPLIDGNGNFGSPGNDPSGRRCGTASPATRWCAPSTARSASPGSSPAAGAELDARHRPEGPRPARRPGAGEQVLPLRRTPDAAAAHPRRLRADRQRTTIRCWSPRAARWCGGCSKTCRPGDRVVLRRAALAELGTPAAGEVEAAVVAGAHRRRGWSPATGPASPAPTPSSSPTWWRPLRRRRGRRADGQLSRAAWPAPAGGPSERLRRTRLRRPPPTG